jgi:amino acid transporter
MASDPPESGAPSHALRRDLGLRDLVPMQVLLVVGFTWTGVAGHQGGAQLLYWLLAVLLMFLPVAAVIDYCVRIWPLEGGVYQWVKHVQGPFAGFLSAWNFGAYLLFMASSAGLLTATSLSYAIGPKGAWIAESQALVAGLNVGIFAVMFVVNRRGLGLGRWVSHVGTAATLMVVALLTLLLIVHPDPGYRALVTAPRVSFAIPVLTLSGLNLFTKLAFGGLCGLEQVAVFAGETRSAARSILRSAWIAAPLIALIYIMCTASVLTYSMPAEVDLVNPVAQLLDKAFAGGASTDALIDWRLLVSRTIIVALALSLLAQITVYIAALGRLPLVAAWDDLIPGWFTRLHPRYRTPTRSLLFIVGLALVFSVAASAGAGSQETWQIISVAANSCYAINYVMMFAVPLVAGTRFGLRPDLTPSFGLRVACGVGGATTLLALFFGLVPILDLVHPLVFALKIGCTVLLVNALGMAVYLRGWRQRRATPLASGHTGLEGG